MEKTIVLLDSSSGVESVDFKTDIKNLRVFSFTIDAYNALAERKIPQEIADNFLEGPERQKLFDFVISRYNWYDKYSVTREMEFEGLNLLGIMDTQEFHEDLMLPLRQVLIIHKIIEKEKPDKIITTHSLESAVKAALNDRKIHTIVLGDPSRDQLIYDTVELKFNLGRVPISIKFSKKTYAKLKSVFESSVCSLLGLWHEETKKRKTILLLEFNPTTYRGLLDELGKSEKQIVLLNRRRSAIWNFESISIIRGSNTKIVDENKILEKISKVEISNLVNKYSKKLDLIWQNDEFLMELFFKDGISFWPAIKQRVINSYTKRLYEYVRITMVAKKIFEKLDISCVVCLNEVGETEKTVLKVKPDEIPIINLLHGFSNYHKETADLRWIFDINHLVPHKNDKIFVWGKADLDHYSSRLDKSNSELIVVGSPRYDSLFKTMRESRRDKIVMLSPEPITEFSGHGDVNLALKYEATIQKIYNSIKKLDGVKLVVKLHPGQNKHNADLINLFRKIDKTIPIYHTMSPIKILQRSDVLLNITCEAFDPSTVMLEGMILQKPVIEVSLDERYHGSSDNMPFVSVFYKENIGEYLEKTLFDEVFRNEVLANQKRHLDYFLSNHGIASKKMSDLLISY